MDVRPIRNEQDYDAALERIDRLMDREAEPAARDEIEVLVVLVKAWEAAHHPIGAQKPAEKPAPSTESPRR